MLVAAILELGFALRLLRLDTLPAEMWGDVVEHYGLAAEVAAGHPFLDYRFGADGPMFSYAVAFVAHFAGLSFYSIKLTTVLLGSLVILATYFLADEMFHRWDVALITTFLTSVSFWSITFSRQAKPYILVPLFVALSIYFALRRKRLWAGICLGLGMYTQAAFWGTPLVFLIADPLSLLVGAIVALPEIRLFFQNPSLFSSGGYVGEKLVPSGHDRLLTLAHTLAQNAWKNALSFNVTGDNTFRHNIPGHPSLDQITGLFFLLGLLLICVRIVRRRDTRLFLWFLLPFVVIQLPSLTDPHPASVPSMARSIGVFPFAFMAAAYGMAQTARYLLIEDDAWKKIGALLSRVFLAVVLAAVLWLNVYNYFEVYPQTLPNRNTPFDRVISARINALPPGVWTALIGCCWGDWGQPEPGAVEYERTSPHELALVPSPQGIQSALRTAYDGSPRHRRLVLFVDPNQGSVVRAQLTFLHLRRAHLLTSNGWNVAWVFDGTLNGW
jgi:hypothetical protein